MRKSRKRLLIAASILLGGKGAGGLLGVDCSEFPELQNTAQTEKWGFTYGNGEGPPPGEYESDCSEFPDYQNVAQILKWNSGYGG